MRLYVLLGGLVAVALAVVLIAGGGGSEGTGAPANAKAAVNTVLAFQKALADRDYAKICNSLFTFDAREASGGGNCQSVLAQNASRIRSPEVKITGVVLQGNTASISVVAQVEGGQPVGDTIRLVRSGKGGAYRIVSAGSASSDS